MYIVKNMWAMPDIQESFSSIKKEAELMVKKLGATSLSRKVGTMLIYKTFIDNWGKKERPESLGNFPFQQGNTVNLIRDISGEEMCDFLTFQILCLFADKNLVTYSSIETTKRTDEFLEIGLKEFQDESLETIYAFYESQFIPQSLTDERCLLPGMTQFMQPSLNSIRSQQPMDFIKLNKIKDEAIESGRRKALDSKRLKMPS